MIRSYFKPNPERHGKVSNFEYWKQECARMFLRSGRSLIV